MPKVNLRMQSNVDVNHWIKEAGIIYWPSFSWKKILGDDLETLLGTYWEMGVDESKAKERAYFDHQILPLILKHFPKERIFSHHSFINNSCTLWGVIMDVPDNDIEKVRQVGAEITESLANIVSWEVRI